MMRPFEAGDRMVYNQIFVKEELKPLTNISDVKCIVDAGAHVGMAGRYFKHFYPESDVLLFESEHDNFEILQENFPDDFGGKISQCLNLAVWSHPVSLGLTKSKKSTAHSCYLGGNEVEAIGLDFVFQFHEKIDILKMDIEGAEKYVFGKNTDWIKNTRNIAIEIHKGCKDIVMKEINKFKYDLIKSGEYTIFKNIEIKK